MAWVWPATPEAEKPKQKNEVSELEHIYASNLTTRDAPFGTEDTPMFKEKIIGGRYVSVLERPYGANAPRYEKLSMVSDKPNHVDPRTLNDFSRRYNKPYQDPFAQGRGIPQGRPTNLISKRPDSKDISSRYPLLPPIEENRLKNHQISTVFEPEAWTTQFQEHNKENMNSPRRPYNSSETYHENGLGGFKPLYNPRGSGAHGYKTLNGVSNGPLHSYPDEAFLRRAEAPLSQEEFIKKLINMLPKNVFLPEQPLILTQEDEVRLLQILAEELQNYSPLKLRDIYLDIANTVDKQLSGFCEYKDLYYSMSRQMFNMSGDLLQVTAAMFVSGERPNRDVNYEKFLSFVGLALKQANQGRNDYNRPKTPVEKQVDNYFADSEQAKLVSTVEQQLRENDYIINFSKLENELSLADRLGKGILDLRTIMDVCYQLNIPLQSSVLNRVLQRCRINNYDDCYNWRTFLEFLQKTQPARIRSDLVKFGRPPPPAPVPQKQYTTPPASKPVTPLWRRNETQIPPDPRRSYNYDQYDDDRGSARGEVISRMDQDIRQLERNYEEIKEKLRPRNDTPWFKNFMEFANAIYKQDERYEGDLPADDVYRWTKMYNEAGNLGFPDHFISKALSDSSKGGKVNIHTYLSKLGNVPSHDKI